MELPLSLTEPVMMNNGNEILNDNGERDEETERRRSERDEWYSAYDLPPAPRDHNGCPLPVALETADDFPY